MILISGSWGRISGRKTSVAGHAPTTRHFYDKPKEKDVHVLLHQGTFIKMNNQNNRNSSIIMEEICCRLLPQQNSNQRNEIGVLMYHRKFNKRPLFLFYSSTFPVGNLVKKVDGYGILQDIEPKHNLIDYWIKTKKKSCRNQDSNLGCFGHNEEY